MAKKATEFDAVEHPEKSWEKWTTGRIGMSRSSADKCVKVHKVLGGKPREELAGVPASRLYKLAQDKTETKLRNRVLRLAAKHWLTEQHVDQILAEGDAKVSFSPSDPSSHEELREYVAKKMSNLARRLSEDVKDDLPVVLREIADELSGVTEGA